MLSDAVGQFSEEEARPRRERDIAKCDMEAAELAGLKDPRRR